MHIRMVLEAWQSLAVARATNGMTSYAEPALLPLLFSVFPVVLPLVHPALQTPEQSDL